MQDSMHTSFPSFLRLPLELQDEVWCSHLRSYGMRLLCFTVRPTLDVSETHSVYATEQLQQSNEAIKKSLQVSRRAFAVTRSNFPSVLVFYNRREVSTGGMVYTCDKEVRLLVHKQRDMVFLRDFEPRWGSAAHSSTGLVTYRLGNFDKEIQTIAVGENFAAQHGQQCFSLLDKLKQLKRVFVGMEMRSSDDFLRFCRHLIITSNACHYICASNSGSTSLVCCWPATQIQHCILDLFERFSTLLDAASEQVWDLSPMALFVSEDTIDWRGLFKDGPLLMQRYGLRICREEPMERILSEADLWHPGCESWIVQLV